MDREITTELGEKVYDDDEDDSDEENHEEELDFETIVINQLEQQYVKNEDLRPESILEVNLHNVGLTTIDIAALLNLKNLKKLILSFNKLTSIAEISNMVKLYI